jgi:hypothetical protein
MKALLSKKFVIAATGLVMLGGAAGAVAATVSSSSPSAQAQAYLNDLAGRLGVSPTALSAAVKAADSDQVDAALKAGRLTQSEATALKTRIEASAVAPFVEHGLGLGAAGRLAGGARGAYGAAATYLGISDNTLRSDLLAGQSLAAIASATPNKNVAGLTTAIIDAETTQLTTAASDGRITSGQETQRLADLPSRVAALVQRSGAGGHGSAGAGGWARGGHGFTPSGSTGATGPNLFGSNPAA